jgi:hypothetical protein
MDNKEQDVSSRFWKITRSEERTAKKFKRNDCLKKKKKKKKKKKIPSSFCNSILLQ